MNKCSKTVVLISCKCDTERALCVKLIFGKINFRLNTKSTEASIHSFILLPEKFLQFDWLRADVFQLNLKYLHVKITVTMVTPNHHIISSHALRKNGGKILDFEIRRFKN